MLNNSKNTKHKPFWPIFIIVMVALVAGGIIVYSAYDNITQDDINSANFFSQFHLGAGKVPANTASAKKIISK